MKKTISIIFAVLVFCVAGLFMLYPLISTYYNDRHQSSIKTEYQEVLEEADTSRLDEAREAAIRYNAALVPGVQDSTNDAFSNEALQIASEDYDTLLNITGSGIMGYVVIPKISVNLPIYHGTGDETLAIGIGHLLGTSLPVGGESTHAVLTGHSGMSNARMFTDLEDLEIGDVFLLEVLGETLAYQVDQVKTVLPYETSYLTISKGEDLCTLVTCTPLAVNTHRLLVRGHRIEWEDAERIPAEEYPEQKAMESSWMKEYLRGIFLGLALAVAVILAVYILQRRKR